MLRLAFFAVPFALLYFIGWPWWVALIIAALAGASLSVIFLHRPREAASESIYDWRNRDRTPDDIVEDDAIEASAGNASQAVPEPGDDAEPGSSESARP